MASNIVIKTDIDTYVPVYNKMEIAVLETDAPTLALTGYQYLFDVYIEGVSGYKRYEVLPESVTKIGAEDISRWCESYVYNVLLVNSSTVPIALGANANGTACIIKVTVKYGYSYLNSGVYTAVPDQVTGSAKYVWNGSLDFNDWYGLTYNDYICNIANGANGQFLTRQKSKKVSLTNLGSVGALTDTPTDIDKVVYETYDSSGTLIATNIKAITVTQAATVSRYYLIATGPESINNMTGGWISGGPNPIITSSVSYYKVYLVDTAGNIASETLTYTLEEPCRYDQVRLHFWNELGGPEQFNFNLNSRTKRTIERKGFKFDKFPITSNGISRSHQDQAQVINYVKTQDTIQINSDFLTETENELMKEMMESNEMYLEWTDETGAQNYKAVESVVGNTWESKSTSNDKLFRFEGEIKMSQSNYGKRR